MTDPTILAALDAACRAECMARARVNECQDEPCAEICRWCRKGATAAVAAFLNAPPPPAQTIRLYFGEVSPQGMRDIYAYHRWLAAVVAAEQAAKEGEP
jgi:hypothetical protein